MKKYIEQAPISTVKHPPAPIESKRRHLHSAALFEGEREVLIEHAGELYSLRHTSKGKLLLTK